MCGLVVCVDLRTILPAGRVWWPLINPVGLV